MNDNTWLLYKLPLLQNRGHCAPCLLHFSESEWLKLVFGSKSLPELCRGLVQRECWGVGEGGAEQGRLDWPVAEGWVMAQAEGLSCPQGGFWEPAWSSTAFCWGSKCLWQRVWPKSTSLGVKAALSCDAANFPCSHLKYSREQKGKLAL